MRFHTIDEFAAKGKQVLLRADLNVPLKDGRVADRARLEKLVPTIGELARGGARVVICSHLGRPKGKRDEALSLRPVAEALGDVLARKVGFAGACVGPEAERAVAAMADGDVLVLENTRFDPREEKNDPAMAEELARLGDVFVNDAFSAAHRAHASTAGVARKLPSYAGRLMQAELEALSAVLQHPQHPLVAVIGGAKVDTKLGLLANLVKHVDVLVLGGAMANTFLAARGLAVGKSLQDPATHKTAREILAGAGKENCEILLPEDVVVGDGAARIVAVNAVPEDGKIMDLGPATVRMLLARLPAWRTLVWNGPLGAFETKPFDAATTALAKAAAAATEAGHLTSVAGGGDTLAALRQAGVAERLTYVSTAGGAFLEWLEGRTLPGVAALEW